MVNGGNTTKEETVGKKHSGKLKLSKRFRWILVLIIVVVCLGAVGFLRRSSHASAISGKGINTFTVRRDDLTISVTESGDIKALNSIDIKSEVEGRTTIISIVDEGTYITTEDVNNGKILVELDSSEIKEKLTRQEITFLTAEASYTEAAEAYEIQKNQNESDIKAGEMAVRFAMMDFQKYLGGIVAQIVIDACKKDPNAPIDTSAYLNMKQLGGQAWQELTKSKDNITLADSKLARAEDELAGTQKLYESNYVTQIELKGYQLERDSFKFQTAHAELALKLFRLYEFPKETEKLLSDYHEAIRELERIKARARSELAQAKAKLVSKEATFTLQKKQLSKFQKQYKACIIRAPAPGQVVYSSSTNRWERRNRPIEIGGEIRERQKIISIPDTSAMKVELKIHETWIDKINPGQKARINIVAFPDKTFTGIVLKKAPLTDPQHWMNPDLKVYSTDVSIDGTHEFIITGMSAKVEVIIEELKDVISVPIQSVVTREGEKVCYVVTGSGIKMRKVEMGLFNNDFIEIKSGLAVGEKVLLNPPRTVQSKKTTSKQDQ